MEAYMLFLTFSFSFFLSSFPLSHSHPDNEYSECRPSPCGKVGPIDYPFWSEESHRPLNCGRLEFQLHCPQDEHHYPSIKIDSQTFNVTQIDLPNHKMTLMRTDFVYNNCSSHLTNTSVSTRLNLFHYDDPSVRNVTLFYDCSLDDPIEDFKFTCQTSTSPNSNSINYAFYSDDVSNQWRFPYLVIHCGIHIQVPVSKQTGVQPPNYLHDLVDDLGKGFRVQYNTDGSSDEQFSACEPFNCGNITNLSYPFWSNSRPQFCGHPRFKLDCEGDNVTINMASKNFRVIDVNSSTRTLTMARMDLWGTKCPKEFHNLTLDYPFFNYTSNDVNSTILYDCDPLETTPNPVNLSKAMIFDCPINGNPRRAYFSVVGQRWFNKTALGCRTCITVPVLGEAAGRFIEEAIDPGYVIARGFEVEWELIEEGQCEDCRKSGGRCGCDVNIGRFTCFCFNQSYDQHGFCVSDDPVRAPTLRKQSMFSFFLSSS